MSHEGLSTTAKSGPIFGLLDLPRPEVCGLVTQQLYRCPLPSSSSKKHSLIQVQATRRVGPGVQILDVVAMLPRPSVACTSGSEAPRSTACEPYAWCSQCDDTASLMPALAAARFTMP